MLVPWFRLSYSQVRHMVDALGHGTPVAADQAQDMVGRAAGQAVLDPQPGLTSQSWTFASLYPC